MAAALKVVAFDFDGVFTDNGVYVFDDGREAVRCTRADGIGLRKLEGSGVHPVVISTEANPVVSRRCEKLRIECHQAIEDKVVTLAAVLERMGVTWKESAFVGNDVNDEAVLGRVGLPIVVHDAQARVQNLALYQTCAPGGHGAVREICDLIASLRGG